MSDGGKGSKQRPGKGYDSGWDAIFGKKNEPEIAQPPFLFTSGQQVVFKLDDPTLYLDYLRNYVVENCFLEKRPNGQVWITLVGMPGTYEQEYFEDFEEWASHQRRVVE